MSQTELALASGMKQQSIDNIEHGVVSRPRLLKEIARALKTTEEWLLWAEGPDEVEPPPPSNVVGVIGLVGAGGSIDTGAEQIPAKGNLYEIEVPFPIPDGAFALQVSGESMIPRYEAGDVIICTSYAHDPTPLLGYEAAVETMEGSRYLKRLVEGSQKGFYDLESFNARTIRDVRLRWASEVYGVVRVGRWRRLNGIAVHPRPKDRHKP